MNERRPETNAAEPVKRFDQMIFTIRGQNVVLDAGVAALYGVATKRSNEQVKRNIE